MRVIIADDESLIRASLKSMLEETDLPIKVVGQATDGQELISLVEKFLPDIAFVDIKMPILNGLEAIKASKEISPCTQWIILTGFKDFDYAREALSLGATCYLLKPISSKELDQVLRKTINDINALYLTLNKAFENELVSIVNELSPIPDMGDNNILKRSSFQSALFIFDSFLEESLKAEKQLEFCKAIRSAVSEHLNSSTRFSLFTLPSGELAVVGAWGFSKSIGGKDMVQKYFRGIESLSRQYSTDQFSITVIACDESSSLENLIKTLNQMHNFSALRVVSGHGKILPVKELGKHFKDYSPELLRLCNTLLRISSAFGEKAYTQFITNLDDLDVKLSLRNILSDMNIRKSVESFLAHSIGYGISACQEPKMWVKDIRNYGETLLIKLRGEDSSSHDILSQILLYIEQNYSKDFGLAQIAEQFNVTPNYLSTLFHRKTGTTFINYITRLRMLKAKELLSNSNTKVQQVAEHLGYCSARHFSRVFKKFYGCYPSDYLNNLNRN